MRISNTISDSIVDGRGFRFVVFTQGCPHRCEGCHNPSTHDFEGGREVSLQWLLEQMRSNPLCDGLTLSGGEPFAQAKECFELARMTHEAGMNVWCYTGYTFEQILESGDEDMLALLRESDVLVDGPFILEQRTLTLRWRGSRNQRVLDSMRSLEAKQAVWLEGECAER